MSETNASGFYPANSDPAELRRAVLELARAQERGVLTFKQHMELIAKLESNLGTAATSILSLTTKVTELQTKMAIYAGMGAAVGGALMAAVMHFFTK